MGVGSWEFGDESYDIATDWCECVESLRSLFAAYYGAEDVARRLEIPDDYTVFMVEFGCGWHQPDGLGRDIFSAAAVVKATADDFNLFVIDRDKDEMPQDDGLWLCIGWFSDKHAILLCCDRSHPNYGQVIDYHDSHPWLNGVDMASRLLANSFLEWLEVVVYEN